MNTRHIKPVLAVGVSAIALTFTVFVTGSAFLLLDFFGGSDENFWRAKAAHCRLVNSNATVHFWTEAEWAGDYIPTLTVETSDGEISHHPLPMNSVDKTKPLLLHWVNHSTTPKLRLVQPDARSMSVELPPRVVFLNGAPPKSQVLGSLQIRAGRGGWEFIPGATSTILSEATDPVDISLVADHSEPPVERIMQATIQIQDGKPRLLLKPYHDGFVARSGWVRCEEFSTVAEQFVRTQIEGNVSEPVVVVVAYETLQELPKDAEPSGNGDHKTSRPRFLNVRLVAIRLWELSS